MYKLPSENKRTEKRYSEQLEVMIDEPICIRPKVTQNISQGGIFINFNKELRQNSGIQLRVFISNHERTNPIRIQGKVVFSLQKEQARVLGLEAGMGVQFTDFPSDEDERRFTRLLKTLQDEKGPIKLIGW